MEGEAIVVVAEVGEFGVGLGTELAAAYPDLFGDGGWRRVVSLTLRRDSTMFTWGMLDRVVL